MNLVLEKGQVAVLRTDTLYGLVARASDQKAVEKVYSLKGRDYNKPCIVLVADQEEIGKYGKLLAQLTEKYQGQPVTGIVPKTHEPQWVSRGGNRIAYRIPQDEKLRELLRENGPLIAPSANPQGLPPARNIEEAKKYFGEQVDYYIDGGQVPEDVMPSRIIEILEDGTEKILR